MNKARQADKSLIIEILSSSFDTNRSVNAVVRQDKKRTRRIKGLMDYSYEVCNRFGEVWISDNREACALVLFPDKKRITLSTILLDAKLATNVIGIERVARVLKRESIIKANHPLAPMAYLWFIGVSPASQGKGIGSAFLREIVHHYGVSRRPIYLETSVELNLPFYKKFGFEIFNTLQIGYTLYQLRRV